MKLKLASSLSKFGGSISYGNSRESKEEACEPLMEVRQLFVDFE
jgi:hypothetical protein